MRLSWLLFVPTVVTITSALAIAKRDADFYSVRTQMHRDMSGKGGDPSNKYFHESVFHPHYDGRFADHQLGYRERKQALSNLIQTYLATFNDIGVETWLMHGTLLGWWWNRKILPWDSDSDVQVTEASMHYLASYYNMSVFHYKTPRIPEGRDYMLEINPHYVIREQADKLNVIDARWVDTASGLFIDITAARYNHTHPAGAGMLSCKDGHEYRDSYIFPLRDTFFEGTPAKIPFAYKEVLEAEYKQKALTQVDFEGHHFDDDKLEWIPVMQKVPAQQKTLEPPKVSKSDDKLASPAQGNINSKQTPNNHQHDIHDTQRPQTQNDAPDTKNINPQISQPQSQQQAKPSQPESKPKDSTSPMKKPAEAAPAVPEVPKQSEPKPPAAQRRAEEKLLSQLEKQQEVIKKSEENRRTKEEKFIVKKEKKLASQKALDEKRAAKKAKTQQP